MDSTSHPPIPRLYRNNGIIEAESTLNLGEFADTPTLSLSEARVLINAIMQHRTGPHATKETETLVKTQDYLDVFARFKQQENIHQLDRLLRDRVDMENFEKSQLGSLCCETAEEAKTLIPSLQNKISDVDLQDLLDEISKLRNFTE